ncbi:hypothetical protein F2981_25970 (plasmid) [Sinorhizobium meliloti]|nr:hypothetical protein [Sinorhizobium meliloti]
MGAGQGCRHSHPSGVTDVQEAFVALVTASTRTRPSIRGDPPPGAPSGRRRQQYHVRRHQWRFHCAHARGEIRLTEEVVDEVGGRVDVIVNAGMPATFETLQLARCFDASASAASPSSALLHRLYAGRPDPALLHGRRCVETPVYLYDIPSRTQNTSSGDGSEACLARQYRRDQGFPAVRQDTLEAYLQVARDVPGFEVYSGPDHLVLWSLQTVRPAVFPASAMQCGGAPGILSAFNNGNIAEAERQQAL